MLTTVSIVSRVVVSGNFSQFCPRFWYDAKVLEILNHEEALAMYKMIRRYQINQDNFKYENNNNNMETIQYPSIRAPRPVMSMEQLLPDDE